MLTESELRPDHYRVLRVSPTATIPEIQSAYIAARQRLEAADRDVSNALAAHRLLTQPGLRQEYDFKRALWAAGMPIDVVLQATVPKAEAIAAPTKTKEKVKDRKGDVAETSPDDRLVITLVETSAGVFGPESQTAIAHATEASKSTAIEYATWEPPTHAGTVELVPSQRDGLRTCIRSLATSQVAILTGPAGSGKTTILRALLEAPPTGCVVALGTPTNKAGVRLSALLGVPYATLHRRLYGGAAECGYCPVCDKWTLRVDEDTRGRRALYWYCTVLRTRASAGEFEAAFREAGPPEAGHQWVLEEGVLRQIPIVEHVPVEIRTRLVFSAPVAPCGDRDLLVIDEGSMVGSAIWDDLLTLLPPAARVLVVADSHQLAPVNDTWGPDLLNPTGVLDVVHRQGKGSALLGFVTSTRTRGSGVAHPFPISRGTPKPIHPSTDTGEVLFHPQSFYNQVAGYVAAARCMGRDITAITYTNKARSLLNEVIREASGLTAHAARNGGTTVTIGDRILVRSGTRPIKLPDNMTDELEDMGLISEFYMLDSYCAGEVWTIAALPSWSNLGPELLEISITMSGKERRTAYLIPRAIGATISQHRSALQSYKRAWIDALKDWLGSPEWQRMAPNPFEWVEKERGAVDPAKILHIDFGECLTCHAAQGSQWQEVHVIWDNSCWGYWRGDNADAKRWVYTAVTRASARVGVWMIPGKAE